MEQLIIKIYEDYALEKLPEKRYINLLQIYEQEQEKLETEIAEIQSILNKFVSDSQHADNFIKLVNRYTNFEELTPTVINEFIEKIVVHAREQKGIDTSPQKVEIHLNFIGEINLTDTAYKPTQEEFAEQERREKEQERCRKNYLKRKEKGYYNKAQKKDTPKAIA